MRKKLAQRTYTQAALNKWFLTIETAWEGLFSLNAITQGRRIYKRNELRQIELTPSEAIAHFKLDENTFYVVIDTHPEGIQWRGSINDKSLTDQLAVAALYEIEELIVQEQGLQLSTTPTLTHSTPYQNKKQERSIQQRRTQAKENNPPKIAIHFYLEGRSLLGNLYHIQEKNWIHFTEDKASATDIHEREALIQLINLYRKTGFTRLHQPERIVLKNVNAIEAFIRNELNFWNKHFKLKLDPSVQALTQKRRTVQIAIYQKTSPENTVNLDWTLKLDGKPIPSNWIPELIKFESDSFLAHGYGFIHLDKKAKTVLNWWETVNKTWDNAVPRYMLFSLFAKEMLKHIKNATTLEEYYTAIQIAKAIPSDKITQLPKWLFPFQKKGVQWMHSLLKLGIHPLLADEMGLGKTIQTLSLIHSERITKPILLVCPASVVQVWVSTIRDKFPKLACSLFNKNKKLDLQAGHILITSYTQLRENYAILQPTVFAYMILDEAHCIKNPKTKTFKACVKIHAEKRLALTGTPIENKALDLWSIFHFLMPGLLGSYKQFQEANKKDPEAFNLKLKKQLEPFILRRKKEEVLKDLPEKIETTLIAPLSNRQKTAYQAVITNLPSNQKKQTLSNSGRENIHLFALLTRLRRICCDPGLEEALITEFPWQQSGKVVILLQYLKAIFSNKKKVIIISQFLGFLDTIEQAIKEEFSTIPIERLTGASKDRAAPVERFQNQAGAGVILLSLKAGGVGITLHSADYVFLMDPWWNPSIEKQAIDRAHRIGQKNTVFVYNILSAGTIEERIQELKAQKSELFKELIENMPPLKTLSTLYHSLDDLIQLREPS